MDRPKLKKSYYIPGIFSLAILPIIFYVYATTEIRHSTVWAIPIFVADTAFLNKHDIVFLNYTGQFPPHRNYTSIILTENQQDNKTKLAFSQTRIREIVKTGDTLNGLHFVFGDSSNFGAFVEVVDKLRLEGAKTYMSLENNLWFYHFLPDTTVKPMKFDWVLCNDVIYGKPEIPWWTQNKKNISHIWETSWQLIMLYCFFVISVFALRSQNKGS